MFLIVFFKDVYFQSVYFLPDKINSWSFFKVKYSASTHSIRRKTPSLIVWRSEVDRRIGRSDLRDEMWPLDENLISASIAKLIWTFDFGKPWRVLQSWYGPTAMICDSYLENQFFGWYWRSSQMDTGDPGNVFNWISLQGQLDTQSVLSAYVTQFGLQSTYLQTFGENGKCMFLRQEMAFAKSCPRFLWIPVHRCTQLMPQSCLKTQNLTKVSTESNLLQYGHSLGPWTWLESNAAPLWNEMNCPLSHDPPDYCTTENAEYIFLGCWLCIW